MFEHCHNSSDHSIFIQWNWPNGKSYEHQDQILVDMFSIIRSEAQIQVNKKLEQQRKANKNKG